VQDTAVKRAANKTLPVPGLDVSKEGVVSLAFSSDDSLLAVYVFPHVRTGGSFTTGQASLLQVANGQVLAGPQVYGIGAGGFIFLPKGNLFAIQEGSRLRTFDNRSGKQVGELRLPENGQGTGICFDNDNNLFAAMLAGNEVIVRRVDSGQETMRVPWDPRRGLAHLSARLVLVEDLREQPGFTVWDMSTGKRFGKEDLVLGEAYWRCPRVATPDGRIVACINENGIHVVQLMTGEMHTIRDSPTLYDVGGGGMAISPDGKKIAVPHFNRLDKKDGGKALKPRLGVTLFDSTSGQELAHFPDASCAAFSQDGKTLAVANGRGEIELREFSIAPEP
jgi:hypothetical protein